MSVILVKSTHPESQGPCVRIDHTDFKAEQHELYTVTKDEATLGFAEANGIKIAKEKPPTAAELKAAAKQQEDAQAKAKEAAEAAAAEAAKQGAPNDGTKPPENDPTAKPAGW